MVALVAAATAIFAPTAEALVPLQRITSPSGLTNINLGNDLSCQITAQGDPQPSFEPIGSTLADCGTYVLTSNSATGEVQLFGPSERVFLPTPDQLYTPDASNGPNGQQRVDAGNGTVAVNTQVLLGTTGLNVTQTDVHTAGSNLYVSGLDIQNNDPAVAYDVTVSHLFLCFLQGGTGGDFGFHDLQGGEHPGCATGPGVSPFRNEGLTGLDGAPNWVVVQYGATDGLLRAGPFPNACSTCAVSSDLMVGLSWTRHLNPGAASGDIAWHTLSSGPQGGAPEAERTANAATQSGTVRVQAPGGQFVDLAGTQSIPVGSVVDTTKGVVTLTAAATGKAKTQRGTFGGGVFKFTQAAKRVRGKRRLTTKLTLRGGKFSACNTRAAPDAGSARRRVVRYLAAKANGQFTVVGKYSSGLERGTTWRTSDTCGGTLTTVTKGTVAVNDFAKRKTVLVRAGRSYLARPR